MTLAQDLPLQSETISRDRTPIIVAILAFAALSIAAAITSEGFLEADACTHYLYARFAFAEPHYFIDIWGRPICTAVYSIPALLGQRLGVRLMSLVLAVGCGLVAQQIARNQRYRWPQLALIFTLAQPLVFLHSFSELTELPFAFLLGLGFLAYQTRRMMLMALLIGLTPLSRPEGFGFLLLAAIGLIIHRRWLAVLVLPIPLLLWDFAGWKVYGGGQPNSNLGPWWRWLIDHWPYSKDSVYPPGPLLLWLTREEGETACSFLLRMPVVVSPFLLPFFGIGVFRSIRNGLRRLDWNTYCQFLIAVLPIAVLAGHSFLWWRRMMASNGELRYLIVMAPFWGLLSAQGWEWCWTRMNWSAPFRMAGIAALLPVFANSMYRVVPIKLYGDSIPAKRLVQWYQRSSLSSDYPRLGTGFVEIYYYMDISPTDHDRSIEWHPNKLAKPTPGTILIWDPVYAVFNSDQGRKVPLENLIHDGWVDVTDRVPPSGNGWRVLLSPQDRSGAATGTRSSW